MNKRKTKSKITSQKITKTNHRKTLNKWFKIIAVLLVVGVSTVVGLILLFFVRFSICQSADDRRQTREIKELMQHPIITEEIPGVKRANIKVWRGSDLCFNPSGFYADPRPSIDFDIIAENGNLSEAREFVKQFLLNNGFALNGEESIWGVSLRTKDEVNGKRFEVSLGGIKDKETDSFGMTLRESDRNYTKTILQE